MPRLNCSDCPWSNPETCRACRQEETAQERPEMHLELGALVGFREYLGSRGVDPNGPGIIFAKRAGCITVELPQELAHHLSDFLEHKMERSKYN